MCTHFLYPFLCWWTFRLLPFLGYCKQHCNEYWRACILSDHVFLQAYAQKWDCRVIVVVQSPSHVQLFAIPWIAAFEASLSITISQSLPKFMFNASVMLSSHLILWCPLILPLSIFPSIRNFSNESSVCIRWPKYWSFSFSISPSSGYSGLISLKIDWFDLLSIQVTFRSLLQHHSWKASILCHSAFW